MLWPTGVSLRATGCWELPVLASLWQREGMEAVRAQMAILPEGFAGVSGFAGPDPAASRGQTRAASRGQTRFTVFSAWSLSADKADIAEYLQVTSTFRST
jgi:hypothetical protein